MRSGIVGEKDNLVTMHDILDAQWLYDNTKVFGICSDRRPLRWHAVATFVCRRGGWPACITPRCWVVGGTSQEHHFIGMLDCKTSVIHKRLH